MKKTVFIGIVAALLFSSGLSIPVAAAQDRLSDALLTNELRALTAAVENLAAQIGKGSGHSSEDKALHKLDIAIAYLNFRSRRIEMFERELQTMRTSRNRLEDVIEQLRQEEENLVQAFGSDQQEVTRKAKEDLKFRHRVVRDRIERLDSEIVAIENRVYDMQRQIDNVESFVQKNMKF